MSAKGTQPQKSNSSRGDASTPAASEDTKTGLDQGLRLAARFQRFFWDIGGIACLALAFMTLLALLVPAACCAGG